MTVSNISRQTLARLPHYLNFLKTLPAGRPDNVSATTIADALGLNPVQVRKDLAVVSSSGRPKIGYITKDLILEMETFLGYKNADDAVIVGAGRLGRALMGYEGFKNYGLNILAAFDVDPAIAGAQEAGKPIFPVEKLRDVCARLGVQIGIITVPAACAQTACDELVAAKVRAIWNFAPVRLIVPNGVLVQNEDMASSLAILSNHLAEEINIKEM